MRKNALKNTVNPSVYQQCKLAQEDYAQVFSGENLDSVAREHNFIKRSRKITASSFVKTLVFSEEDHEHLSLLDLKCDFFAHADCHVSQEAIHKRFTPEAVSFLKEIFSQQLSSYLNFEDNPILKSCYFNGIYIKDSTKFKLPLSYLESYPSYGSFNKTSALMNIQYEFDILTGNWHSLELTKATRNDQADSKETIGNIKQGSLNIRDLGYITSTYLRAIEEKEAYYLNRLPKIGVYQMIDGKYKAIDWQALDKKIKKKGFEYMVLDVYLGKKEKLKSRMIMTPLPKSVASERIRKANVAGKRTKGYQVSKVYKIKASYNIFITNVPEEQLSAQEVNDAYKLRWQIELIFKTWKSNLNIQKVKSVKTERMECQLMAKLIWILLNSKLLQIANRILKESHPHMGCSPVKFFKRAKHFSQTLLYVIMDTKAFYNWYDTSIIPIIPSLTIEKRLNDETHCQILSRIFIC